QLLRPRRVGLIGHQPQPARYAMHVRVDGEVRTTEREEQHARRGLRADAAQTDEQVPERGRTHASEGTVVERDAALAQRTQELPQADRLRRAEAATADGARDRR